MNNAETRSDKPRRAVRQTWHERLARDSKPVTRTPKASRTPFAKGVVVTLVSGIGLAALAVFGPASSQAANGLVIVEPGPVTIVSISGVTERTDQPSRSGERVEVSVDELASQRAAQIAQQEQTITQAQQDAALEVRTSELSENAEAIETEADRLRNLSRFQWPTAGGVGSPYGMRLHPILRYYRLHDGVDIGGKCGANIYAAQSGVVTKAEMGYNGGSGNNVYIDHGNIDGNHVATGYFHMTDFNVSVGQRVNKGDLIGHVGNTGLSTACHLHLTLKKNGASTNPLEYVKK